MTEITTETKKIWKQAPNQVTVVGTLAVNNLVHKTDFAVYENGNLVQGQQRTGIQGDIVIATAENEKHTVRYKVMQLTNAGKENSVYPKLLAFMNSAVSMADSAANPELTPSRVEALGSLERNEFGGSDGQLRSYQAIKGAYNPEILPADSQKTAKAEFDLEGYVAKVVDEIDRSNDNLPTGRKKVELYVPLFNSVVPLDFVVDEGDGADYIGENFTKGATVRVYGALVNYSNTETKTVSMGFGADKVEEFTTYVNENNIRGGSLYEPDIHTTKIIDQELMKEKLADREKHLENLKERGMQPRNNTSTPQTGFGHATPPATGFTPPNVGTAPNSNSASTGTPNNLSKAAIGKLF